MIIASIIGTTAVLHGTKQPMCANKTQIAIYLIYVDFPPIFGPVIMCNLDDFLFISRSLAIQVESIASNKGCLDSFNKISFFSVKIGLTKTLGAFLATDANEDNTSISDINLDAYSITG